MRVRLPGLVAWLARPAFALFLAASSGCKGPPPTPVKEDVSSPPDSDAAPTASVESAVSVEKALPPETVETFVNPAHLPVYQGPTGSVEGTVTLIGDPSPDTTNRDYSRCREGRLTYGKLFREGPVRPDGARPVADVLVVVTGYAGAYLPDPRPVRTVTIADCALSSRTIDMTIGQRLDIKNLMKDKIFAPAFLQMPSPLALVAPPLGDPVSLYPQAPHAYTLYDRFGAGSSYLTSEVYVLLQPLHAVTDPEGHYRIDGVPVGAVKVNGLLGVIQKEATKAIDVQVNVIKTVDLQLRYTRPPPKK
jgi:hypothetical protein